MSEALPEPMIAQLEAFGMALVAIAKEHRDGSLQTLERETLGAAREALPGLLLEVLKMSTMGLQPAQSSWGERCPTCDSRIKPKNWRPRTVTTVCGTITFERPWFVCEHCRHGFSPADQTLEVEARSRLSEGVREWAIELGATTSFAEAAWWLERLTGIKVSAETVREQTEGCGAELEVGHQAASEHVMETRESPTPLDPAPGALVVETDGAMVRYQDGFHEVKLGVVGGHEGGKTVAPSYVAARAAVGEFGPRLLAEAARRGALEVVDWRGSLTRPGMATLREVTVLGDGAAWIWNLANEHFGERTEIVDFYHASEHVWKVANALHGEGSAVAKTWAHERVRELAQEGVEPVQRALREATAETPEAEEALRLERGYFRTHAARMDYPTFRARGLPIGSGVVESSAQRLVHQRMKKPGARWSESGAQGVLNVRCRTLSRLPLAS